MKTLGILFFFLASLPGLSAVPAIADQEPPVSADAIRAHLEFLADDLLEGRGTGTRGEMLAVRYLETQCRALGLHPAGDAGSFRQRVGFVRTEVMPTQTTMEVRAPGGVRRLEFSEEYVVLSSHHDHLGIGRSIDGDAIYNGAYDNAAGCAVLLEVARCFAAAPVRPRRSLLFLWLTGEEAGMLGSDFFAAQPTVPRERIVANLNFDGPVAPVAIGDVIGYGVEHSSLAHDVRQAAARTGFVLTPDPVPEEGMFARTDQISFVKRGIPGVFLDLGIKAIDPGVDVPALRSKWRTTVYHSPKDDTTQPIHYPSSVRFAQFLSEVARAVADAPARPRWNDGDFFGRRFARRAP